MKVAVAAILSLLAIPNLAIASEQKHGGGTPGKDEKAPPSVAHVAIPDDYCANIADQARDARYQLQAITLNDLRKKLEEETARLEAKRASVEALLKKREEEMNRARRELIDIYAKMKPDAAAAQLSLLDPETSASVMRQLKPQGASAILTEMKPEVAAAIAALLAQTPDKADAATTEQGT
jgi:flagellar motility protein MotE (MotC chaperone)